MIHDLVATTTCKHCTLGRVDMFHGLDVVSMTTGMMHDLIIGKG